MIVEGRERQLRSRGGFKEAFRHCYSTRYSTIRPVFIHQRKCGNKIRGTLADFKRGKVREEERYDPEQLVESEVSESGHIKHPHKEQGRLVKLQKHTHTLKHPVMAVRGE